MKLTKKDRLFLINQYKILSNLLPNASQQYDELIEILENGYEIFYSQLDDWIYDEMPESEGRLVLDILGLYRAIEDFKRRTKNSEIIEHYWGFFKGFDGNHETEYMSFAQFLINIQGKFSEQKQYLIKNDNCNSHSQMLDFYRKMIEKWDNLDRKFDLSKEEILSIFNHSE